MGAIILRGHTILPNNQQAPAYLPVRRRRSLHRLCDDVIAHKNSPELINGFVRLKIVAPLFAGCPAIVDVEPPKTASTSGTFCSSYEPMLGEIGQHRRRLNA